MTIAESLIEEGMIKGMMKGEIQGKQEMIKAMLAKGHEVEIVADLAQMPLSKVVAFAKSLTKH